MSPIHDHAGSNCWVKVLEGELEESLYDVNPDGQTVTQRSTKIYKPPGVTYICGMLSLTHSLTHQMYLITLLTHSLSLTHSHSLSLSV
jgi:cysteine dioxygenase